MVMTTTLTAAVHIGKTFTRDNLTGKIKKGPPRMLSTGQYQVNLTYSLRGWMDDVLSKVGPGQCLCLTAPSAEYTQGNIVPKSMGLDQPTTIHRTKEFFVHAAGPGILCIDYDEGKLTHEEFVEELASIWPVFGTSDYIVKPSSSAGVIPGKENNSHLYFLVEDAQRIPEVCSEYMFHKLIDSGHDLTEITESARRKKTIIDPATFRPTQPDYAAEPQYIGFTESEINKFKELHRPQYISKLGGERPINLLHDVYDKDFSITEAKKRWKDRHRRAENKVVNTISKKTGRSKESIRNERAVEDASLNPEQSLPYLRLSLKENFENVNNVSHPLEAGLEGKTWLYVKGGAVFVESYAHGGQRWRLTINEETARQLLNGRVADSSTPSLINNALSEAERYYPPKVGIRQPVVGAPTDRATVAKIVSDIYLGMVADYGNDFKSFRMPILQWQEILFPLVEQALGLYEGRRYSPHNVATGKSQCLQHLLVYFYKKQIKIPLSVGFQRIIEIDEFYETVIRKSEKAYLKAEGRIQIGDNVFTPMIEPADWFGRWHSQIPAGEKKHVTEKLVVLHTHFIVNDNLYTENVFTYRGQPRQLHIQDEDYSRGTSQVCEVSRVEAIIRAYKDKGSLPAKALEQFSDSLKHAADWAAYKKQDYTVPVNRISNKFVERANWAMPQNRVGKNNARSEEDFQILQSILRLLSSDEGYCYVTASGEMVAFKINNADKGLKNIFVLDATREYVPSYSQCPEELLIHPIKATEYDGDPPSTVMVSTGHNTGKNYTLNTINEGVGVNTQIIAMNKWLKDKKVGEHLLVGITKHVDHSLLKELIDWPNDLIHILTWGLERQTNKYRDCSLIAVLSLHHLPELVARSEMDREEGTVRIRTAEEIRRQKQGKMEATLIQLCGRGTKREGKECHFFIAAGEGMGWLWRALQRNWKNDKFTIEQFVATDQVTLSGTVSPAAEVSAVVRSQKKKNFKIAVKKKFKVIGKAKLEKLSECYISYWLRQQTLTPMQFVQTIEAGKILKCSRGKSACIIGQFRVTG